MKKIATTALLSVIVIGVVFLFVIKNNQGDQIPELNPVKINPPLKQNQNQSKERVRITNLPLRVQAGETIELSWVFESAEEKDLSQTAIYYSEISKAGSLDQLVSPEQAGYNFKTEEYEERKFKSTETFYTSVPTSDPTKIYLRAHALVEGQNFWTTEKVVIVE